MNQQYHSNFNQGAKTQLQVQDEVFATYPYGSMGRLYMYVYKVDYYGKCR